MKVYSAHNAMLCAITSQLDPLLRKRSLTPYLMLMLILMLMLLSPATKNL